MSNRSVTTAVNETALATLFQSSLGDQWEALPPAIRNLHSVQDTESFSGTASIFRGKSLFTHFLGWVFRFPPAGDEVPVTVTITRTEAGETWERNFDGHILSSYCMPASTPHRYQERFGLFKGELDLLVENECLRLPVTRGWFAGLPLPRLLLPRSDSSEYVHNGDFRFDITLSAPLGVGFLVRYCGYLRPDRGEALPPRK